MQVTTVGKCLRYVFCLSITSFSSLFSWHGKTKMLLQIRFKSRWSVHNIRMVSLFLTTNDIVCHFHYIWGSEKSSKDDGYSEGWWSLQYPFPYTVFQWSWNKTSSFSWIISYTDRSTRVLRHYSCNITILTVLLFPVPKCETQSIRKLTQHWSQAGVRPWSCAGILILFSCRNITLGPTT